MDNEVRRAVRTLHRVGFEGLSNDELEEFIKASQWALCLNLCPFRPGDRVRTRSNQSTTPRYGTVDKIVKRIYCENGDYKTLIPEVKIKFDKPNRIWNNKDPFLHQIFEKAE